MTDSDVRVQRSGPGSGDRAVLALVRRAARAVLAELGVEDATVSITLTGDAEISELNRRYLTHEGPTDVLSFALHGPGEPPVGDVYIGVDQAARQAGDLGIAVAQELARLAIHGTLHVLGWEHPEEGREDSEMWRLQERILEGVAAP